MEETENKEVLRISCGVIGADETDDIIITRTAVDAIKKVISENDIPDNFFLRFDLGRTSSSGKGYFMEFDATSYSDDRHFTVEDINIVISAKSLFCYMGVTIDFVVKDSVSGFVFMFNDIKIEDF